MKISCLYGKSYFLLACLFETRYPHNGDCKCDEEERLPHRQLEVTALVQKLTQFVLP